ncbi:MAG: hypothetical protein VKP62_10525 [Candidatus Sericytochromatia bacterium]|nr:hypothetical protein [Candidatus Sericytochromatia bacterium]
MCEPATLLGLSFGEAQARLVAAGLPCLPPQLACVPRRAPAARVPADWRVLKAELRPEGYALVIAAPMTTLTERLAEPC